MGFISESPNLVIAVVGRDTGPVVAGEKTIGPDIDQVAQGIFHPESPGLPGHVQGLVQEWGR
jgi:hypothetical protein